MPQVIYDLKGYPQFVYTAQDFAERKARKQPDIKQLANLLIRSIFEDGGLGRVLSIDEVTPGTPANGWTIRFTGETNGRTADPYIAIYDGQVISYNDDFSRQPRDLSEGLALALEFAAKKGQKNCNKGKPCGGSCIAKGRNCLKDKKDLTKNQQQATDEIAKAYGEIEGLKAQISDLKKQVAKLEAENKELKAKPDKKPSSGPKIESYEDFKSEVMKIYDQLNEEYNLGDLVPIYRIRRTLGDRVSRSQFKDWLLKIQANDEVQLQGSQEKNPSKDQLEDSITIPGNELRFYVRRLK